MICIWNSLPDLKDLFIIELTNQEVEYDEEKGFREINKELEQFEHKPKLDLSKTKEINLESTEEVKGIKICLHVKQEIRDSIIQLLFEFGCAQKGWKYRSLCWLSNLNKDSPKGNFPLPSSHILINNRVKHEIQYFVEFYVEGYHQTLMDKDDIEKITFTILWGTYFHVIWSLKCWGHLN